MKASFHFSDVNVHSDIMRFVEILGTIPKIQVPLAVALTLL